MGGQSNLRVRKRRLLYDKYEAALLFIRVACLVGVKHRLHSFSHWRARSNPGYASRYGIPPQNANFNFILSGRVQSGAP